ncbi:hypothetical protein [Streptomyces mirabilis]|uniref:hypothetical protein n=1 Tax=Streptomyces mirabilis TaxID=68239 RepID=UPI0036E671B4
MSREVWRTPSSGPRTSSPPAEPKEPFVIDGATHIDLYDKDECVTPVVAKLTEFFGKHLAG